MKKTITMNERELHRLISESVKRVLNENNKKEIFTLNIFNISEDEGIDDMKQSKAYYSIDDAIEAAKQCAYEYSDYDDVINVFVMAGEYEYESGDIYGEPEAIYCVSNKSQRETQAARMESGFSNTNCDEYLNESKKRIR